MIKAISENDIRARILRIPAKIKERIPESMTSYTVTFNGETVKELTIAKERDYFAKVTELYKKYGLIDADGSFISKQIIWSGNNKRPFWNGVISHFFTRKPPDGTLVIQSSKWNK